MRSEAIRMVDEGLTDEAEFDRVMGFDSYTR
jgi:hypothetical protein